jgi:hypothetical protein
MRSGRRWMGSSRVWMRSSRVWMRGDMAVEAVLNNLHKKSKKTLLYINTVQIQVGMFRYVFMEKENSLTGT